MARRKRLVSELPAEEAALLHRDFAALFDLYPNEIRWAEYYEYLLGKGYQLRPRFRPGWVPSWKDKNLDPHECEDSWSRLVGYLNEFKEQNSQPTSVQTNTRCRQSIRWATGYDQKTVAIHRRFRRRRRQGV